MSESAAPATFSPAHTLQEADHCVKCGLCLPTCPTYRLYADENESPRGRIALAEALIRGQIGADPAVVRHLGSCLQCRRCETVCPSGVRYHQIVDHARTLLGESHVRSKLLRRPRLLPLAGQVAAALPGNLGRLARSLPHTVAAPAPGLYPSDRPSGRPARGKVGLLLGCVTRFNQGGALHAALALLNRLGYVVTIPAQQGCCGALAQHHGSAGEAQRAKRVNRQAFRNVDAVVSVASGCSLQLSEYGEDFPGMDILQFLDQAEGWDQLGFEQPRGSCLLHQPCSLVNGLGAGDAALRVLQRVPGGAPETLGQPGGCCGAGGEHLLTHRDQAVRLRAPLVAELARQAPEVLLTSNVGCAMHLAEGVREQLPELQVRHPVEWLVRHLQARID